MIKIVAISIIFSGLLFGCSLLYKHSNSVTFYDLSSQQSQNLLQQPLQQAQLSKRNILISDASAPPWLDNTAIYYRLAYHNSAQFHRYANSRWIASPTVLLSQKMRDRIAKEMGSQVINNNNTAKADHILHIELEEFAQIFDSAQQSHALIALRASLIKRNTRDVIAQNYFSTQAAAPSSDAGGAVAALSAASDQLINKLIAWMIIELPSGSLP